MGDKATGRSVSAARPSSVRPLDPVTLQPFLRAPIDRVGPCRREAGSSPSGQPGVDTDKRNMDRMCSEASGTGAVAAAADHHDGWGERE